MTSRTDLKSKTPTYTYNDRNELTNITYPNSSYASFAYNDAGERLAAGSLKSAPNNIKILIEGKLVEYTSYLFDNGAVSVGKSVISR